MKGGSQRRIGKAGLAPLSKEGQILELSIGKPKHTFLSEI